MKRLRLLLFFLIMPINVLAYSKYIIPGGETIGIEVKSGVMVIGFYEVNGHYNYGNPTIKAGDYITKVNDIDIYDIETLTKQIETYSSDTDISVTVRRDDREYTIKLPIINDDGIIKTGLYVKDSITGIGTLSYIDPNTKIYGALGHEIVESNTNKFVEIKTGDIFRNYITSVDRSTHGYAGSKNAKFFYDTKYGSILKNTIQGIYGKYDGNISSKKVLEVGMPKDIKIGKASIYTVLKGEEIGEYEIYINKINYDSDIKNITFTITDKNLLKKTGGVIQGMSGSPIIQNNKIIGTITHVIVDNPESGYGIFITKMLEEGEKNT